MIVVLVTSVIVIGFLAYYKNGLEKSDSFVIPVKSDKGYIEGQIIVNLKDGIEGEKLQVLVKKYNLKTKGVYSEIIGQIVLVPVGKESYYVDLFKKESEVNFAGLNHILIMN